MATSAPPPSAIAADEARHAFSTRNIAEADQFAAWREFIAPTVDLSLVTAPKPGFAADQVVWDLGSMALTVATMPGDGYVRAWRHWRRPALDHWCLVLCPDTSRAVPSFHFGMRSLASSFQGSGSDEQVLSLFIPRDLFPQLAARLDRAPTDIPLSGLGAVLADHLLSLERQLPHIPASDVPQLAAATQALLVACLAPSSDATAEAAGVVGQTLRERARRIIRQNIASASLSPESLCRELGVSRSRLYRMFEELGGVARYIQRQRLLAALDRLADPSERAGIAQIADALGFLDHSSFSRAFRAEFGLSPSEAREGGCLAPPRVREHKAPRTGTLRTIGDVLGRLQP